MIWGKQDLVTTPVLEAIELNKKLSNSILKIFEGPHALLYKKTKIVIKEIVNFLERT